METVTDFIFLGSKITAQSDCNHEIKRYLPLGQKKVKSVHRSVMSNSATSWTVACQSSLSMVFFRQENWSWQHFLSPGYLTYPGIESGSPALQGDSLLSKPWKLKTHLTLPTKVHIAKAMVFPVVMYGCESCTIKTEHGRIYGFELWC